MIQINPLAPGQPVPALNVVNQRGDQVRLSDFHGRHLLLYFYPKAMTPGCTTQACALRDSQAELAAANLVVLGVSPDSPERLQRFIDKEGLNFDLLSDPEHQLASAFGVWGEKKFMGKTYEGLHRISFLINEQGVITHVLDKVKTKSHHQDVLKLLAD